MNNTFEKIKERLIFDGIIDDSLELDDKYEKCISNVNRGRKTFEILSGEDLGLDIDDIGGMLIIVLSEKTEDMERLFNKLFEKIKIQYSEKPVEKLKHCSFYFYSLDMQTRYLMESFVEKELNFINEIRNKGGQGKNPNILSKNIHIFFDYIPKNFMKFPRRIAIKSRILVTTFEQDVSDGCNLTGKIYTARLRDIATLFEYMSNDLFRKNIRYGIADNNDVDNSINYTLRNNPKMFWFLNNGITLYADGGIDLSSKDYISILTENFSIINGAQTITSAAKFFLSGAEDKEKIDDASKYAFVLLRVIVGPGDQINHITVGLNRQKPITKEDIYFVSDDITSLNSVLSDLNNHIESRLRFQIIRRGEVESYRLRNYGLVSVLRTILAVRNKKPGYARTKSIKQLISDTYQKEILDFMDQIEQDPSSTPKHIGFINKSMKFAYDLSELSKSTEINLFLDQKAVDDKYKLSTILKYGKYHIMSGYMNAFTPNNDFSYSNEIPDLTPSTLKTILEIFKETWESFYFKKSEPEKLWDSNMFKKHDVFSNKSFVDLYVENLSKSELSKLLASNYSAANNSVEFN